MEEERTLALEIQKGSKQAMQTLVQANLKFVVAVCRNYTGRGLPIADLVSEGNLGLIRAAQRFDGSMNFKFISYAVWWIRQGILAALAEQTRTLNVSTSQVESLRAVNAATRKLEQALSRAPTMEELSAETGKTAETIMRCRSISNVSISLNRSPNGDETGDFSESLADRNGEETDRAASKHLLDRKVRGLLDGLGERERSVVSLYYGIGSDCEYTLSEIGERLHLTRERIRQIKEKALRRMLRPAKMRVSAL